MVNEEHVLSDRHATLAFRRGLAGNANVDAARKRDGNTKYITNFCLNENAELS
jgi:hypothetical protein